MRDQLFRDKVEECVDQ